MKSVFFVLATSMLTSASYASEIDPVAMNTNTGRDVLVCREEARLVTNTTFELTDTEIQVKSKDGIATYAIARAKFKRSKNRDGHVDVTELFDKKGKLVATHYLQNGKESVEIKGLTLPCVPHIL